MSDKSKKILGIVLAILLAVGFLVGITAILCIKVALWIAVLIVLGICVATAIISVAAWGITALISCDVKGVQKQDKKSATILTHKGIAVISAIDSGLCPPIEDGWDTDGFEKFWEKYQGDLEEYRRTLPIELRLAFDENSN